MTRLLLRNILTHLANDNLPLCGTRLMAFNATIKYSRAADQTKDRSTVIYYPHRSISRFEITSSQITNRQLFTILQEIYEISRLASSKFCLSKPFSLYYLTIEVVEQTRAILNTSVLIVMLVPSISKFHVNKDLQRLKHVMLVTMLCHAHVSMRSSQYNNP